MPGDVVVSAVASQQATVPHSKTVSGSTGLLGSFKWRGGWMQYNDCAQLCSDKDVTSENPWMCCYEVVFKLGNIQFEGRLPSSVHLPSLKSFKWILLTKSGSTAAIIYLSYYFLHCTSQISSFLRACTKNHSCNTVHHESFKHWVLKWCTFFTWSFK